MPIVIDDARFVLVIFRNHLTLAILTAEAWGIHRIASVQPIKFIDYLAGDFLDSLTLKTDIGHVRVEGFFVEAPPSRT